MPAYPLVSRLHRKVFTMDNDYTASHYDPEEDLSEREGITTEDYQIQVVRTVRKDLSYNNRLGLCGLGLSGEVGEVTDILKKFLYHHNGKPLDKAKLCDELGDLLWYFSLLCTTLGISIDDVMYTNVQKLQARHPQGFQPQYSSDSHVSE